MFFLLHRFSNAFESAQIAYLSTLFPTGCRWRPESQAGPVKWVKSHFTAGVIITGLALAQPVAAQDGKESDRKSETPAAGGTPSASQPAAAPDANTEGSIVLGGQTIVYRSIVGTLTVGSNDAQDATLSPDGKQPTGGGKTSAEQPTARMSYVAYFSKNAKDAGASRPITFLYNGGPGGPSLVKTGNMIQW
jgi:carboxypeptidase C (cathepsin A)